MSGYLVRVVVCTCLLISCVEVRGLFLLFVPVRGSSNEGRLNFLDFVEDILS